MSGACHATENDARRALCDAVGSLDACGSGAAAAASLSMRWHRGGADGALVTPARSRGERIGSDDLLWMPVADAGSAASAAPRFDGTRRPAPEWRLHRDLHAIRPDAGAVVHAHPGFCTTLACLPDVQRDGIPAFHHRIVAAGGAGIRCARYAAPGSPSLAAEALAALAGRSACLLAHHGLVALGATLAAALATAGEVEALARIYWQALQLGGPAVLPDDEVARLLEQFADDRLDDRSDA